MKNFIFTFVFASLLLVLSQKTYANTLDSTITISKESICKNWVLKEYKENGKLQALYDYEIEFFSNGKYVETDDGETNKGVWKLNANMTKIIFDAGTLDEDEFIIINFEPKKMVVEYIDEDKIFHFILVTSE